jgi:homoserine O-acetyltransferase
MTVSRPLKGTWLAALFAILVLAQTHPAQAHWPGQPQHQFADLGAFQFEAGGSIPNMRLSYVTHGKLNAAKDNAILFLHGFAANHHAPDHLIGPGKALDPDKYFIIVPDELGGPQTTFEHSTSPTNSGLGMNFPAYNGRDRVKTQYLLVTQALGIPHLLAAGGISSGADDSVQMALSYPGFIDGIFPISGGGIYSTQYFFFNPLMMSIIESCTGWEGGRYEKNPPGCASNSLSVYMPFFYTPAWWDQYIDSPEAYTKWRNTQGAYYFDIQDARDLYFRIGADTRGWLGDTPGYDGDLARVFGSIKVRTRFFANPSDQFVARQNYETMASMIPGAQIRWIESSAGHLTCCNADPNATQALDRALDEFLNELVQEKSARK